MIAKIVKGTSFGSVVKYILDTAKQTNLLAADGVRLKNLGSIAQSFETQRELNPRVSKPVGHISLDFSAQDRAKLTDEVMTQIAYDYMNRMGIVNTQCIIGRHHAGTSLRLVYISDYANHFVSRKTVGFGCRIFILAAR